MGALVGRAGHRPQAVGRKIMPHWPVGCMADWSQRAALRDGPYDGPGRGLSFVVVPPLIGEVA